MTEQSRLKLESTAWYEIHVQGMVTEIMAERINCRPRWIEDSPGSAAVTVLTGHFIDQAALAGALSYLFDMGYPLLSVQCLGSVD